MCALRLMTNGVPRGQSPQKQPRDRNQVSLRMNPCRCVRSKQSCISVLVEQASDISKFLANEC